MCEANSVVQINSELYGFIVLYVVISYATAVVGATGWAGAAGAGAGAAAAAAAAAAGWIGAPPFTPSPLTSVCVQSREICPVSPQR